VQFVRPGVISRYSPLYIGLLPLALAIFAIGAAVVDRVKRTRRESSARSWFWSAVAVAALLISAGNQLPVFSVLYWLAPGFRLFRDQERYALIVVWALSLLAAYGGDVLFHSLSQAVRRWLPIALLVMAVIDLAANNRSVNWVAPYDPFPAQAALTAITADAPAGAIYRLHNEQRLPGHAACVAGLNEVGGITPIHVGYYDRFIKTVPREVRWQLLNVRYVVSWRSVLDGHLGQPVDSQLLDQRGEGKDAIYTYRLNQDNPRAWIVHEVDVQLDRESIYAALGAPEFEPYRVAYTLTPMPAVTNETLEPVSVVSLDPNQVRVDATLTTPGLLILSDVNYPGWAATANGVDVPIVETDGLLRGVALPAGHWHVEMDFRPSSLGVGASMTLIGLSVWVSCLVWSARRRVHG
jgi:hypothetical protein